MFSKEEKPAEAEKQQQESLATKLIKSRTIVLTGEVDQEVAEKVITQLLLMDADSNEPIRMIISSNGGHVESGMAIHDVMRFIKSDIIAIGAGWVVSIAVPILFGAKKENRLALPNTRFMIHQPIGGVGGQATDVRIAALEIVKIREKLTKLIADETGQPFDKVASDSDRNYWLNADEALDYGLIARIIKSADDI
jgi:ATP-dependent Clp protease protease subunit